MCKEKKYLQLTYSYLHLRRAVGLIGVLLPPILVLGAMLIFGGKTIQPSISHYYHTVMRDLFVGALCAVALFMFFYSGHDKWDDWTGHATGAFALVVAWFPTTETGPSDGIGKIHFIFAALFFLSLIVFTLVLFRRKDQNPTPEKLFRNKVYLGCGIIMSLCLLSIVLYLNFLSDGTPSSFFVFCAETLALVAFGVSWLIKGGTLWADKGDG